MILAGAALVLAPFVWLVPAVFKSGAAFNDYVFFPPLAKWPETMSLENFRKLFAGRPSLRGPVYFWEYFLNSTVIATVTTTLQILFSLAGRLRARQVRVPRQDAADAVHARLDDDPVGAAAGAALQDGGRPRPGRFARRRDRPDHGEHVRHLPVPAGLHRACRTRCSTPPVSTAAARSASTSAW